MTKKTIYLWECQEEDSYRREITKNKKFMGGKEKWRLGILYLWDRKG